MTHTLKLPIHATPGARRTEAAGAHGAALRVRLAAPPVDGKANTALLAWAAQAFGVTQRQVELLHGASSRQKTLAIHLPDAAALRAAQALVAGWMISNNNGKNRTFIWNQLKTKRVRSVPAHQGPGTDTTGSSHADSAGRSENRISDKAAAAENLTLPPNPSYRTN